MKQIFIPCLVLLAALSAHAAKIAKPNCSEIQTISDSVTPQYVAVIDGYDKSYKKQGEEIDVAGIVTESTQLKEQCQKQQTKALQSVKNDIEKNKTGAAGVSNSTAKINPVKASCKEFLTLGEAYQPVAVFWAAGHDKSGKMIKEGEVDEEFLSRPIAVLVEDCKANPTASFYTRAKNWLSKKL